MKILPIKLAFNLLILSFLIVTGLTNCGQQKNDSSTVVNVDSTKLADVPTVTTDSMAVNVNADTAAATDNSSTTVSVKKTTVVKTVITTAPTGTAVPAPVTKPVTKPVTTPVTTPPVVKAPEPVKPAPVTPTPTPVEVPKPVVTPPVVVAQPSPGAWIVPAKYKSMKSPYPANSESLANGKSLYSTHCKSCHGSKGDGNGTKAATLDTKVESFLTGAFRSQTAGEVFYKTTFGRKDMPKYEKKIPDEEDRWAVVNYVKSL